MESLFGEELQLCDLDAEGHPAVGQFLELLVDGEPVLNLINAVGSDEFADAATSAREGELGIGSVALGLIFAHALAGGVSTLLVLHGDAAGVHGAYFGQLFLNERNFRFHLFEV